MSWFQRERTPFEAVLYGLYLYFLGLSFRCVSDALDPFVRRSHVAVWKWVQGFDPRHLFCAKRVSAFLVDETYVKVGSFEAWILVALEPIHRFILGAYLSRHQNMLVAEAFLKTLVERYGRHMVYSDGGSWYPETCRSLGLKHRLHSPYEQSLIERAMEYLKDRIEQFDDDYPCLGDDCDMRHADRWLQLFTYLHDAGRRHIKFTELLSLLGGEWTLS